MEINKNLFAKADSLVDEFLSCLRIRLPKLQKLVLCGEETRMALSDSAQQLHRKNADVPDFHFSILDATGKSPTLFLNQKAEAKERGSWFPFNICIREAPKVVHTRWCCLWVCAQNSES